MELWKFRFENFFAAIIPISYIPVLSHYTCVLLYFVLRRVTFLFVALHATICFLFCCTFFLCCIWTTIKDLLLKFEQRTAISELLFLWRYIRIYTYTIIVASYRISMFTHPNITKGILRLNIVNPYSLGNC